jgi:hypothetical protein
MKKILLAIDATQIDSEAIDFASYVATMAHSTLTGVFLEHTEEQSPVLKMSYGMPYVESMVAADLPGYKEQHARCEENIRLFKQFCTNRGIRHQVQTIIGAHPAKSLIGESRFADLLIIKSETSFEKGYETTPTHFVKEVLAGAECPVIMVPYRFTGIEEVVFTYDGSRSAVFAIKQFTYLFPELADKKAIVLQVNESGELPLTEKEKIAELLKVHYSGIGFQVLRGKARVELFSYLLNKKKTLVVMGAFGRGWLSNVIKPSSAPVLLKNINLPFFITHY